MPEAQLTMRRLVLLMAPVLMASVLLTGATAIVESTPALGCFIGTRQYPSANATDFKVAQASQGGNAYYGTAGTMTQAPPNDPTTDPNYAMDHVVTFFESADARYAGTSTPGLIHAGWAIGFHEYNNSHFPVPTVVAETFAYSLSPVLFAGSAATAGSWYKTQLGFGNPDGTWHYEAWVNPTGSSWSLVGSVDLTSSTTASAAFGEVSDPGNDLQQAQAQQCISVNSSGGAVNTFHSMQLFVDDAAWQNWTAANGRWACAQSENPYRPGPSTINSTDCTQGTFWDAQYTDMSFGGP
jgi:hypothetical protein